MAMTKIKASPDTLVALLLAGGAGQRLGGIDKGLALWNGRPMAHWVADTLSKVADRMLISANRSLDRYEELSPGGVISDDPPYQQQGPLSGLLAGMRAAQASGARAVLVCPCDTPEISEDLCRSLAKAWRKEPERPVVVSCEGRVHPLHGIYPVALADVVEALLAQGERRVMKFADQVGARHVETHNARAMKNRNSPEDID